MAHDNTSQPTTDTATATVLRRVSDLYKVRASYIRDSNKQTVHLDIDHETEEKANAFIEKVIGNRSATEVVTLTIDVLYSKAMRFDVVEAAPVTDQTLDEFAVDLSDRLHNLINTLDSYVFGVPTYDRDGQPEERGVDT